MYGNLHFINPEAFLKGGLDVMSGKAPFFHVSSKDFEIKQVVLERPLGYAEHEGFPFCCDAHKELFEKATSYYQKFPNCCEIHKKLLTQFWFERSNYDYVPMKLLVSLDYSFYYVDNSINNQNWYKEITDYIIVVKESFGQFPDGFGSGLGCDFYLNYMLNMFKELHEIDQEKKTSLINFILNFFKPINGPDNDTLNSIVKTDMNLLLNTYHKWLKDFPFQLSFFNHLQNHFEFNLPLAEKFDEPNLYSGTIGFTLKTKENLVQFLVETTETILSEINTLTLDSKGLLTNPQVIHLELIKANRQIEINEIKEKLNSDREQYIKILKQWFAGEKKYLKEITEVMNSKPQPSQSEIKETKAEKLRTNMAQFGFFDLPKVKSLAPQKQIELVKLISDKNNLSYQIAMFTFLGFIEHIATNYLPTKYKLYIEISKWFNSSKDGREVKGYINSLVKKDNIGKRYNANIHKEKVQKDYQALK